MNFPSQRVKKFRTDWKLLRKPFSALSTPPRNVLPTPNREMTFSIFGSEKWHFKTIKRSMIWKCSYSMRHGSRVQFVMILISASFENSKWVYQRNVKMTFLVFEQTETSKSNGFCGFFRLEQNAEYRQRSIFRGKCKSEWNWFERRLTVYNGS